MNGYTASARTIRVLATILSLCTFGPSALSLEANVTRTNWTERWITNDIEVRMPLNRFVDEYHTNWVTEYRTNIVNVYTTNLVIWTLTNHFPVDAFQTNFVTAFQTNLRTLDLTNWETAIVMQTNWLTQRLTNRVQVDAFETNFVTAYQTNLRTLDLTNWQMAIVMKTNWVTQPVTNFVQVDAPSPSVATDTAALREGTEPKEVPIEAASSSPGAAATGPVVLEAARTARPPNNGQIEVQLKAKANGAPVAVLQVQQWRVEREDRAILCFGQDPEFKRALPAGRYKVEVKLRLEDGSLLAVRGILVLSAREAVIQQNLAASR